MLDKKKDLYRYMSEASDMPQIKDQANNVATINSPLFFVGVAAPGVVALKNKGFWVYYLV